MRSFPFVFYKGYHISIPSFSKVAKGLDIVHIQSPALMGDMGVAVSRKQKIPCVMTYHTPPDQYLIQILPVPNSLVQESLKVFYYKYEKALLRRCTMITAPSQIIIDLLKKRWGAMLPKAVSFSNGIDTEYFKETDPAKFKKDYNVPKGKVIGYTGRHSTEKHLEDLINLADSFDGTVLIGGDGQQHEEFVKLAKGKKNVKFIGFFPRERLCEFYSSLDAFVMPSTAETEGLVVLEANACGTPAVGADAMALKVTVQDGVNGYHYKPGDIKDLAAVVEKTVKEKGKLKASCRKFVEGRSSASAAKRLVELYEEALIIYKKAQKEKKPSLMEEVMEEVREKLNLGAANKSKGRRYIVSANKPKGGLR